jgi:hypothetical protein
MSVNHCFLMRPKLRLSFRATFKLVEDIADFWCQYHLGKPLREWLGTPS